MSHTHKRPRPWRGQQALDASKPLGAALEQVIVTLAAGQVPSNGGTQALRQRIHQELEFASGVVLHHSPSLESLGHDEFRKVFQALCLWLGKPAPINKQGDYIKEVADTGVRDGVYAPQRGHLTNQELVFHTDRADLTVLCCWSPAAQGGAFRLRSSSDVVTSLEERDPALYAQLQYPIAHDLREEGGHAFCYIPLLHEAPDNFVFRYIRKFNDSVVRHGVELGERTRHLLDSVDEEIDAARAYAEIDFRKGTIVMLNNHTTLHMRTQFKDDERFKRCLLRCWLGSEYTRPLPASFKPVFHCVDSGALRGGVR